ncbi:MAG: hypothetical protein LDL41_07065 [Coleofasciculus sp. S288]|nr:hypothetical protein [Coleofasciculus sp. S288]
MFQEGIFKFIDGSLSTAIANPGSELVNVTANEGVFLKTSPSTVAYQDYANGK